MTGVETKRIEMARLWPLLDEQLRRGSAVLSVTGNSMRPMLHYGDAVRLVPPERPVRRGDVILYRRKNGRYVLHRVVRTGKTSCVCCGDAQRTLERNVAKASILGVAEAFTRKGGWVDCNERRYVLYWRIWLLLRPLRPLVFFGWHVLRGLRGGTR